MNTKRTATGGALSLILLGIIFIWLKLIGLFTWSWLTVTAPLWICAVLVVVLVVSTAILEIIQEHNAANEYRVQVTRGWSFRLKGYINPWTRLIIRLAGWRVEKV